MTLFRNLTLFIALLLCTGITGIHGQVTIGSTTPPVSGAILDLKQDDLTLPVGTSATKGLGMPRVGLSDAAKLKMGADPELVGTERLAHTGLMVYNTHEDLCLATPLYKGMYVWDGDQWQYLGRSSSPDVKYETDNRPQLLGSQTYPYRRFGTAGVWMLENMRYLPTATDPVQFTAKAAAINNAPNDKFYIYPNGDPANPGATPATWRANQGLLYTYSAATLGVQDGLSVDQGQVAGATPGPDEVESDPLWPAKFQGICPNGWHIPSDREWNELEAELYNHAGHYSSYTPAELSNITIWNPASAPNAWQAIWDTLDWRGSTGIGGHGLVMQSICNVPGGSNGGGGFGWGVDGKSLPVGQGGFNALSTGKFTDLDLFSYGGDSFFWSASVSKYASGYDAWFRATYANPTVFRSNDSQKSQFSVRCKR